MSDDVRGSCGYNDSFCEGYFDEIMQFEHALPCSSNLESLLLELFGDVRPCSVGGVTIHALVGGRTAQRAASCAPWTELDISGGVEGIESIGQFRTAAIPTGVEMGMRFAEDRE